MSGTTYPKQRMPDVSGNSSVTMSGMNSSEHQNFSRSLDSTDGPHNQHSNNTQMPNQSLNYQTSAANNNHTHHPPNNINSNNNDHNNNPNNVLRRQATNDISSSQDDSDVPMAHGSADIHHRDLFAEIRNGGGHWSQLLRQVVLSTPSHFYNGGIRTTELAGGPDASSSPIVPLQIQGGSENGQFAVVGQVNPNIGEWITVGYLQQGDVLLDIQGQQVAGYTQADVLSLLHHCLQRNSATLTVAPRGNLGPELRSYLNTRFQKGSVDHALQGVVRDNLYLRTVPVTTRPPRPGEILGVDYTFLSPEEFMELERNGSLLESGVYAGNHYGTPKPWATKLRTTITEATDGDENQETNEKSTILPGMHPSSEGKRRRNRSNVEALGAGDDEPVSPTMSNSPKHSHTSYSSPSNTVKELGPLPANWEMSYTEKGEVYFIDHNTGTSHWLDPRLSRVQKTALEDCADNELPFGWELIEDPHYGTYYIDHVNRRTQFENPVLQAKTSKSTSNLHSSSLSENEPKRVPPVAPPKPSSHRLSAPRDKTPVHFNPEEKQVQNHSSHVNHQTTLPSTSSSSSVLRVKATGGRVRHNFFTRDPEQLIGERIHTVLLKSTRGLGFTIVGGDDDDGLDEFLQIKSVVTDGPAWRDGKLRTGDVLVCVNNRCVLGYTHQEMVSIFQSIGAGEEVELEVCRGYPLPFDPADPNTEIVTTVAVAPFSSDSGDKRDWRGESGTPDSVAHSAHSLPELSMDRIVSGKVGTGRPASVDLLLDPPMHDGKVQPKLSNFDSGVFLPIHIMKGNGGFGFTIADSLSGQKVKKVLDPTHCGGLEEGDRLIEIDGINLHNLSHTQVVQVLKDFPLRRGARLIIQRNQRRQHLEQKINSGPMDYPDSRFNNNAGIPRSKTPTGDFGRSRPKLREMLPERPKTPLLDSSGHLNGGHPVQSSMQTHNSHSHPYLDERFSNSMGRLPSNQEPNFIANDLNQLAIIRDWREMTIELQRKQEGFGFRIIGGTEEGSQVSVGHIVPRGAAHIDGRLQTNDQIMAVDGMSVVGASHHSVVQLMARSATIGRVNLTIRRPVYGSVAASPQHSPGNGPIQVTLRRQASEGFGFVIISSAAVKAGATIGRIVEGSPADRCGQVHVGDRILAVNQIDISQLHHSQVVQLIKDSGLVLSLNVLPVGLTPEQDQSVAQFSQSERLGNMSISDFENLNLKNSGYEMGTAFVSPESHSVHFGSNIPGNVAYEEDVEQVFTVQLNRGNRGFGFSIRGGKEFQNMPLFVLRLADDGPAAVDSRMQVGDQILQINGYNTQGMTHAQAIHIIKSGDNIVNLLLRRGAVPFPFLSQAFSSGFGGANGQEEEQSISSNNDPQQFVNQNSPMYRDHIGTYPSQS